MARSLSAPATVGHAVFSWGGFALLGIAHGMRHFEFAGERHRYHAARYNGTYRNERTVELAIALPVLRAHAHRRVLEVGNVTSHYVAAGHRIVDKYERADGVENLDVLEIRAHEPYDLILSISTLEHVGLDERRDEPYVEDPDKARVALEHLAGLLAPGGMLLVTLPLGYNAGLDAGLHARELPLSEVRFLQRISRDNRWREVSAEQVRGARYGWPYPAANAIAIGIGRGRSVQTAKR
jgi:hypothetical protein